MSLMQDFIRTGLSRTSTHGDTENTIIHADTEYKQHLLTKWTLIYVWLSKVIYNMALITNYNLNATHTLTTSVEIASLHVTAIQL